MLSKYRFIVSAYKNDILGYQHISLSSENRHNASLSSLHYDIINGELIHIL